MINCTTVEPRQGENVPGYRLCASMYFPSDLLSSIQPAGDAIKICKNLGGIIAV